MAAIVGNIVGGYIMKRWQLSISATTVYLMIANATVIILLIVMMLLPCTHPQIQGLPQNDTKEWVENITADQDCTQHTNLEQK